MKHVVMYLEGPLAAYGAPAVDSYGKIQVFPGKSMLVGLIANALGWDHGDTEKLMQLQSALLYAARADRLGEQFTDLQTVDLNQDCMDMAKYGKMSTGEVSERNKACGKFEGPHMRYRDYWADGCRTVCLALRSDSVAGVTLDDIAGALQRPARCLFLGRKSCVPSRPIYGGVIDAESPLAALAQVPRWADTESDTVWATWMRGDSSTLNAQFAAKAVDSVTTDERDWANQVHVGQRRMWEGAIPLPQ